VRLKANGGIYRKQTLNYYFVDKISNKCIWRKTECQDGSDFCNFCNFYAALGFSDLLPSLLNNVQKRLVSERQWGRQLPGFMRLSQRGDNLVSVSALIAGDYLLCCNKWLGSFYYRIPMNAINFIEGLAIALFIAVLTISFRILKAASINPAQSLKYE